MLIKAADDKEREVQALDSLLTRPDVDAPTRRRIEREIKAIRAGAAGERDAAYEIEFHLRRSRNRMTIHDLRLEVEGRVAQIDHLIINRLLDVWVCESKHFAQGVAIDEHGEWTAFWGGRAHGIPSPVEQNRKHVAVLQDVFRAGRVERPRRLGIPIPISFHSLILVSNRARISRPTGKGASAVEGLDTVVKVERLKARLDRTFDRHHDAAMLKVVSSGTIERLARELAGLHRPATVDWAARFGLQPTPPSALVTHGTSLVGPTCLSCGRPVSEAVRRYLTQHADRFGGRTLCYRCQRRS